MKSIVTESYFYEIVMQINISENSRNQVTLCNSPCVGMIKPWWKAGLIHLGVQTSKSRESAEIIKSHTTYLFYKCWQEYRNGETQLTDGYRARSDKQCGKYIWHWTMMEIFQRVLRDHDLKVCLLRNFTWWLLFEVKVTYKQVC